MHIGIYVYDYLCKPYVCMYIGPIGLRCGPYEIGYYTRGTLTEMMFTFGWWRPGKV